MEGLPTKDRRAVGACAGDLTNRLCSKGFFLDQLPTRARPLIPSNAYFDHSRNADRTKDDCLSVAQRGPHRPCEALVLSFPDFELTPLSGAIWGHVRGAIGAFGSLPGP